MSSSTAVQFNRTPIYVSLGLAILLVLGTLIGAKMVVERALHAPVAVAALPAPDAGSPECLALADALPAEVLGHERATIAEPVPPGVAVWHSTSQERVTLRCGIDLPLQYTAYSQTREIDGVEWLRVADATPDSTLSTWFAVNRQPTVAVSADAAGLLGAEHPLSDVSAAVADLPAADPQPYPVPLADLTMADQPGRSGQSEVCAAFVGAAPDGLAEQYQRLVSDPDTGTVVWTREGYEPIVARCGAAGPSNYAPGERITQIDEVAWFENDRLVNGSTASEWYALGREAIVAVSAPQAAAGQALPELTAAIVAAIPDDPAAN
ncbi:DUF3515 domain-containing protein [Corynebacterium uterequi]|uniref:Putative DUF3515 family protein n=1 Tax=Corynebacterium uterequi TaxID=1072256 RepID=A0A0G3HCE6_9CORY|nr:DUF3515 domain-containing protein [Corynebacterium uterequi]AKK10974.1 putative DUF3515 family protein [Corynebacterium uterequi]